MDEDLYEADFYTWTMRQAEHLRAGRLDRADIGNIAEGIESLVKSHAATLRSAYRLIATHLLKMMAQPPPVDAVLARDDRARAAE